MLKPNPEDYLRLLVGRVESAIKRLKAAADTCVRSSRDGHVAVLLEDDDFALVCLWLRDIALYIPVIQEGLQAPTGVRADVEREMIKAQCGYCRQEIAATRHDNHLNFGPPVVWTHNADRFLGDCQASNIHEYLYQRAAVETRENGQNHQPTTNSAPESERAVSR